MDKIIVFFRQNSYLRYIVGLPVLTILLYLIAFSIGYNKGKSSDFTQIVINDYFGTNDWELHFSKASYDNIINNIENNKPVFFSSNYKILKEEILANYDTIKIYDGNQVIHYIISADSIFHTKGYYNLKFPSLTNNEFSPFHKKNSISAAWISLWTSYTKTDLNLEKQGSNLIDDKKLGKSLWTYIFGWCGYSQGYKAGIHAKADEYKEKISSTGIKKGLIPNWDDKNYWKKVVNGIKNHQ